MYTRFRSTPSSSKMRICSRPILGCSPFGPKVGAWVVIGSPVRFGDRGSVGFELDAHVAKAGHDFPTCQVAGVVGHLRGSFQVEGGHWGSIQPGAVIGWAAGESGRRERVEWHRPHGIRGL